MSYSCTIYRYLEAALKLFALSEIRVAGKPRRAENLRKASKNELTSKLVVNSRCTPRVEAHVNKQMYVFRTSFNFVNFSSRTNSGPAKSNPVWVNGGSSDTLKLGKSGEQAAVYGFPSTLLQIAQDLIT